MLVNLYLPSESLGHQVPVRPLVEPLVLSHLGITSLKPHLLHHRAVHVLCRQSRRRDVGQARLWYGCTYQINPSQQQTTERAVTVPVAAPGAEVFSPTGARLVSQPLRYSRGVVM